MRLCEAWNNKNPSVVPKGSASPRASLPFSASTMGKNHQDVSESHPSFPFFLVFVFPLNLDLLLFVSKQIPNPRERNNKLKKRKKKRTNNFVYVCVLSVTIGVFVGFEDGRSVILFGLLWRLK